MSTKKTKTKKRQRNKRPGKIALAKIPLTKPVTTPHPGPLPIAPQRGEGETSARARRFFYAAIGLNEIVEGVRNVRWSFNGKRLKDTPEWVEFYLALNALRQPLPDLRRQMTVTLPRGIFLVNTEGDQPQIKPIKVV